MTKAFICRCEDIPVDEVDDAIVEGYDDLESLRRFTALGTGPCQGKACIAECIGLLARHHGVAEETVGLHTMRPPLVPISLGHLADVGDAALDTLLDGDGFGTGHSNGGPLPAVASKADKPSERPPRGIVTDETYETWTGDDTESVP